MKLDEVDRGILETLQKEGRSSYRDLAHRLDVSVPTISSKISRMEDGGLIRGYGADLDVARLDLREAFILISAPPIGLERVAEKICELEECIETHVLTGARILVRCVFDRGRGEMRVVNAIAGMEEVTDYSIYSSISSMGSPVPISLSRDQPSMVVDCSYCKKSIRDEPIKTEIDGRTHYLCCEVCKEEYLKKYKRIRDGAGEKGK